MLIYDTPKYKALYFDLKIKALIQYYSKTNPKGAYSKIQKFLLKNSFEREQYSGYHSLYPTTDLNIFDLVRDLQISMPWLEQCVNKFEVADLGENYNLKNVFSKIAYEP